MVGNQWWQPSTFYWGGHRHSENHPKSEWLYSSWHHHSGELLFLESNLHYFIIIKAGLTYKSRTELRICWKDFLYLHIHHLTQSLTEVMLVSHWTHHQVRGSLQITDQFPTCVQTHYAPRWIKTVEAWGTVRDQRRLWKLNN